MGEAALVLFVSHSSPSPNLACIGPLCLRKRLGGVIGAHPRENMSTSTAGMLVHSSCLYDPQGHKHTGAIIVPVRLGLCFTSTVRHTAELQHNGQLCCSRLVTPEGWGTLRWPCDWIPSQSPPHPGLSPFPSLIGVCLPVPGL